MSFAWTDFGQLKTAEDLKTYLEARVFHHSEYCHYTSLEVIDSILAHNTFRLSSTSGFNDGIDQKQFQTEQGEDTKKYYSLCFSTGTGENLPLWYLYAGPRGDGGRIRLTKAGMKRLWDKATYALWEYEDTQRKKWHFVRELQDGEYDVQCRDVLYVAKKKDSVFLRYNTMTNSSVSLEEYEKYQKSADGFIKGSGWYFEKETRLLLTLNDSVLAQMEPEKTYFIAMKFDDGVRSMILVNYGPEIQKEEDVKKYPHIAKLPAKQLKKSGYGENVEMKICKNCKYYESARKCKEET